MRGLLLVSAVAGASGLGCLGDDGEKVELAKGVVDESSPPGSPISVAEGKADGATTYPVSFESPHPYTNNLARNYTFSLGTVVPTCTSHVRVHFAALRTERSYDFVRVLRPDGTSQSFDGNRDNTWSGWVPVSGVSKPITIRLESDGSITDHGFRVDAVEAQLTVLCPAIEIRACEPGTYDVTPPPLLCGCHLQSECIEHAALQIEHSIGGGFTAESNGRRVSGTDAQTVKYVVGQPEAVTTLGTVDHGLVQQLVGEIITSGILDRAPVNQPSNWNETFRIQLGARSLTLVRPQGSYPAADARLIQLFEALFHCGGLGTALTCGDGFSCGSEGTCVQDQGCVCPLNYDPVCGGDGHTYSNGCAAACAHATTVHAGQCGIESDPCGGIQGLACLDGFKCRYGASSFTPPFPDAAGACVVQSYCDSASDCTGMPHTATPGVWSCGRNTCAWQPTTPSWQAVSGFSFSTPHPYQNNQNVWKELNLPASATNMRLVSSGTFALENGYDKLEVWVWRNNAWAKVKTYTGSTGPALTDEFAGTRFQLHFVSDSSVTKRGFDLTAEFAGVIAASLTDAELLDRAKAYAWSGPVEPGYVRRQFASEAAAYAWMQANLPNGGLEWLAYDGDPTRFVEGTNDLWSQRFTVSRADGSITVTGEH